MICGAAYAGCVIGRNEGYLDPDWSCEKFFQLCFWDCMDPPHRPNFNRRTARTSTRVVVGREVVAVAVVDPVEVVVVAAVVDPVEVVEVVVDSVAEVRQMATNGDVPGTDLSLENN
jgi:hypothetical protein